MENSGDAGLTVRDMIHAPLERQDGRDQLPLVAETVTSRFRRIKLDNFRIAQELVGMRRKRASLREKLQAMHSNLETRPLTFSFGESVWRNSEKYPSNMPMNLFVQDIKKYLQDKTRFAHGRLQNNIDYKYQSKRRPISQPAKFEPFSFCMVGDWSKAIRNYLKEIGWREKFTTAEERGLLVRALQRPPSSGSIVEATRLFGNQSIDFIWVAGYINWGSVHPSVVVSKLPASSFYFSKVSLSLSLKNLIPFIYTVDEIDATIPRTFEIRTDKDLNHYAKHFRINACISILKMFNSFMSEKNKEMFRVEGTVPLECIDFAVKRIVELIRFYEHADLDDWCTSVVSEDEWDSFLAQFYNIAHHDAMFQLKNELINLNKLSACCKKLLEHLHKYIPEITYEGKRNLWICKPSNGCCGRGVKILRRLDEIKKYCRPNNSYVIQKYIEEPLLVYNTKFDIRQWFVITNVQPLIIWMYDECYLRFCSQEFSLAQLHESGHLCNNTVQWKYKNGTRDLRLPKENMWDNSAFIDYLRNDLKSGSWAYIRNQMRQAIIASCIATKDKIIDRANSFQLYGADFMLTPDFKVWLIEINCQPSMKYSTSVTARMCKAVLEDTIKVGLERKINPSISVGHFKQIYHQPSPPLRQSNLKLCYGLEARIKCLSKKPKTVREQGPVKKCQNKWISYKQIANYKQHSNSSLNIFVKNIHSPLQPGDVASVISITKETRDLMDTISKVDNSDRLPLTNNENNTENTDHHKLVEKCLDFSTIIKNNFSLTDAVKNLIKNSQTNKPNENQGNINNSEHDSHQRSRTAPKTRKHQKQTEGSVDDEDSSDNETNNSIWTKEKHKNLLSHGIKLETIPSEKKRKHCSSLNSKKRKASKRDPMKELEKLIKQKYADDMFQSAVEMGKNINSNLNRILNIDKYPRIKKFEYLIHENQ